MRLARHPEDQSGIALVAVLWGVLLLSALAIAFSLEARTETRLAKNFFESAEAEAAADAGVYWAVGELLRPPETRQIVADGAIYELGFAGSRLHIAVRDEAGKVDLNAAPAALIAAAMAAAGADIRTAQRIAENIVERRNGVARRQPRGAARRDRGSLEALRGGSFRLVEELRAVQGVTPALYEAAAPFLTVYSGMGGVDPSIAPLALLRALSGLEARDGEIESRASAGRPPGAAAADRLLKRTSAAVHMIEASATTAAGARFTRRAIVQLSAQPQSPYRFLQWAGI